MQNSRSELRKQFDSAVNRSLPNAFRKENNNIRVGTIKSYNAASSTATVKYLNDGTVSTNVWVAKSVDSIFVGDIVVVVTNDTALSGSAYVIAAFGGNRSSSGYVAPL